MGTLNGVSLGPRNLRSAEGFLRQEVLEIHRTIWCFSWGYHGDFPANKTQQEWAAVILAGQKSATWLGNTPTSHGGCWPRFVKGTLKWDMIAQMLSLKWGFPEMGSTQKYEVYSGKSLSKKDDDWGYPRGYPYDFGTPQINHRSSRTAASPAQGMRRLGSNACGNGWGGLRSLKSTWVVGHFPVGNGSGIIW